MKFTIALLAVPLSLPAFADTYPRQQAIDAIHYTFQLTLTDASDEIDGEATVDVAFLQANVTSFVLDLATASGGKGMTASKVSSNPINRR